MSQYKPLIQKIADLFAKNLFPDPSKGKTPSGKIFTKETLDELMPDVELVCNSLKLDFKEMLAGSMLGILDEKLSGSVAGLSDCSTCG